MIPWIQVYSNLPRHPKVSRLADELGLTSKGVNPNVVATGMLVSLWTWAIQNAYDGDLSGCGARAIADACTWTKDPQKLVDALVASGFLDPDMRLHDWEEYAILLIDSENKKREQSKERMRKMRSRNSNVTDA